MRRLAFLGSFLGGVGILSLPYIEHKNIYAGKKLPPEMSIDYKHPGQRNIPYERVYLRTTDDHTIHGWLMLQEGSREVPTMVYFHSNSGNISNRLDYIEDFYHKLGMNIFIFDYRGYGHSDGESSEEGIMVDTQTVLQFIAAHPQINPDKIVLYGRSLGGAVSIYAASILHNALALIVENSFTSIPDIVRHNYYPFGGVLSSILSNQWPSANRIQDIHCPILFISGRKDKVIPPHQMDELYTKASQTALKQFYAVDQGGHNDIRKIKGDHYLNLIRTFVHKLE